MEKRLPISHWVQPFPADRSNPSSSAAGPSRPREGPRFTAERCPCLLRRAAAHSEPTETPGAEISLRQALERGASPVAFSSCSVDAS